MIEEAKRVHRRRTRTCGPRVGVVLGSGLGAFADELDRARRDPVRRDPGLAASTAVGHAGKLVIGKLAAPGRCRDGRARRICTKATLRQQVTFGVRVLGARRARASSSPTPPAASTWRSVAAAWC